MFSFKLINCFKIFVIGLAGMIVEASAQTAVSYNLGYQLLVLKGLENLVLLTGILTACLFGYLIYKLIRIKIEYNNALRLEDTKEIDSSDIEQVKNKQVCLRKFEWSSAPIAIISLLGILALIISLLLFAR